MTDNQAQSGQKLKNFFISYTGTDRAWAEWIAMQLENAGYTTIIQAWDIRPGSNFVVEMDKAARYAERTIPVLSPAYLKSDFAFAEWAAAFRDDPTGKLRKVLPVRIEKCIVSGLLGPIVYINLVGLSESEARQQLLAGVKEGRAKPASVSFPGSSAQAVPQTNSATFPGSQHVPSPRTAPPPGQDEKTLPKIKALFLAANPGSTSQFVIEREMRAIEQKVRASEHRDALVFLSAWAVQPDDLLQLLNQHKPHIVHFSGHGSSEGLSLVGDNGQERPVITAALKALFTTLKDNIRLVFLNGCYSREQAQALVGTIDCVIGMKESLHDNATIVFASSFYRAIGFGRSIQEAFDQGSTSLLLEGISDQNLPELLVKQGIDAQKVTLSASANPPR